MTMLNIICYAFLLTCVYNRSRSVLLALLMHASFNTANALLVPLATQTLTGAVYQTFQLVLTVTLLIAVLVVVVLTRGRLGYNNAIERRSAFAQ